MNKVKVNVELLVLSLIALFVLSGVVKCARAGGMSLDDINTMYKIECQGTATRQADALDYPGDVRPSVFAFIYTGCMAAKFGKLNDAAAADVKIKLESKEEKEL